MRNLDATNCVLASFQTPRVGISRASPNRDESEEYREIPAVREQRSKAGRKSRSVQTYLRQKDLNPSIYVRRPSHPCATLCSWPIFRGRHIFLVHYKPNRLTLVVELAVFGHSQTM